MMELPSTLQFEAAMFASSLEGMAQQSNASALRAQSAHLRDAMASASGLDRDLLAQRATRLERELYRAERGEAGLPVATGDYLAMADCVATIEALKSARDDGEISADSASRLLTLAYRAYRSVLPDWHADAYRSEILP